MKKYLFSILIFVFVLFAGEMALRIKNVPGYQTHFSGFDIVDSLVEYKDYTTDTAGNYLLSDVVVDSFKKYYDFKDCKFNNKKVLKDISNVDGVNDVIRDFCKLQHKTKGDSDFEKFAISLLKKPDPDHVDLAYLSYINYPFNSHGFKSIPFMPLKTNKTKILLVGDSFAWGMTAKPYYNSFADLLSTKGYVVYNAGITSVDPIQYLHVCKTYVDVVQPDIVIVNYFEGNDLLDYDRIHEQSKPHEHITNAGFFESNPEGIYLNAEECYQYYAEHLEIPKTSLMNRLLAKTAMGSIIWTATHPNQTAKFDSNKNEEERIAITKHYIQLIDSYLQEIKPDYFFTIIPTTNQNDNNKKSIVKCDEEVIAELFEDIEHYNPQNLYYKDYNEPYDFHFNNEGSIKYANFIDSLIQQKLHE